MLLMRSAAVDKLELIIPLTFPLSAQMEANFTDLSW